MSFSSFGIQRIPFLNEFLLDYSGDEFVYGWGRKKSFFMAQAYAREHELKAICLEDGFVRSLSLGKEGCPPLSLVVDDIGIYFDATAPSALEILISSDENAQVNNRANDAIKEIIEYGLTKYNQKFQSINSAQFSKHSKNILVVDQTYGDQSIKYSGADESTFQFMLKRACNDNPDAAIWVKTHPDVLANKAKSHFLKQDLIHSNIQFITENFNPIELLQQIDEVYVVSSQMGFEALLCSKKVHCFGIPWYAGWGLTNDIYAPLHILNNRRNKCKSLEHLFACAYFQYARYVHPVTAQKCKLEDIFQFLVANTTKQKELDSLYIAYGFSSWKKKFISSFLGFPKLNLKFNRYLKPKRTANILAWGKNAKKLKDLNYQNVVTVEDGFIRSVGLGAELVRPCSLVFDDIGIYYDATQPSRLEHLLQTHNVTDKQKLRAQNLIRLLIDLNISKYNVGNLQQINRPEHQHVLLVVGQVEDDMSIQLGGIDIKTNLALLQKVREKNPDSYIIYKPHPDVLAGLRKGKIQSEVLLKYADHIELNASILQCFEICNEVHTITSLSGFEALLRGISVHCYGLPFYAGWGLTHDLHQCKRRIRKVDLESLVYIALVEYASYNLVNTQQLKLPQVRPEDVIQFIKQQLDHTQKTKVPYKNLIAKIISINKNRFKNVISSYR